MVIKSCNKTLLTNEYWKVDTYATVFCYWFVRTMQFFKLNMKDNWEPSVGEVKLWEYQYVFALCPFYVGYAVH